MGIRVSASSGPANAVGRSCITDSSLVVVGSTSTRAASGSDFVASSIVLMVGYGIVDVLNKSVFISYDAGVDVVSASPMNAKDASSQYVGVRIDSVL